MPCYVRMPWHRLAMLYYGLLKSPSRCILSAARGSLLSCTYVKHLCCRSQAAVEVQASYRRTGMQCGGVRAYANFSSDETKFEVVRERDKVAATRTSTSSSADTFNPKRPSERPPFLEQQDLPDLPPFPAKPTIHISPEDITTYLQPLISRQWRAGHAQKGLDEREVLSLNRHYDFKGFNDVMEFVQGVANISREEKHHARIVIEYSTVVIFTHTHSAYVFQRLENGKYDARKVSGLTRRDIRFAIKIEQLHETFKAQGRVVESVPSAVGKVQRWSMDTLLRRYGRTPTVVNIEGVQSE